MSVKVPSNTEDRYQYDFSSIHSGMYDTDIRTRKAITCVRVLQHALGERVKHSKILNVGSSTGIMDWVFSDFFSDAVGVDIDEGAVEFARKSFSKPNLHFEIGDGLNLPFDNATFDVVVCSQVYEHVPDQQKLMQEIWRVLKKDGVCYFSATNRFIVLEPHYRLYFLSWLPSKLADIYVRFARKGSHYYEKMRSLPKLRKLVSQFSVVDYTVDILRDPTSFSFDYVIKPSSLVQRLSVFVANHIPWLCPGFIWILKKN